MILAHCEYYQFEKKEFVLIVLFMITFIGYKAIHIFLHGFLAQNPLHEIFRAP